MSNSLHKILLALGSNEDAQHNVTKMTSMLKAFWPNVSQTDPYTSKAVDFKGEDDSAPVPLYTNVLVEAETSMSLEHVNKLCKMTERMCGDSRELRNSGIVKADIDVLAYDDVKHHVKDWERPYIKILLKRKMHIALLFLALGVTQLSYATEHITSHNTALPATNHTQQDSDKDLLGKAIEYFAGQKYHEALLCFLQLEKTHKLNSRMLAYKGLCLFKEKEYEDAAIAFEASVPTLVQYSPHEQAVYYYAWGECHFQTQYYTAAIRVLKRALDICNPEDKAEILYRMGFSEMMLGNKEDATEYLLQALDAYPIAIKDQSVLAHREQAKRMLRALLIIQETNGDEAHITAYKGLCLFEEKKYNDAAEAFEASVPQLADCSPHEQTIYYNAWGECYFLTQYYTAAVRTFEKALKVCEPEDKAELLYRLGYSEMMLGNNEEAVEWFTKALDAYPMAIQDSNVIEHREQAKRLINELLVAH